MTFRPDPLVLEAALIEAALQQQIENLTGIKSRITLLLDHRGELSDGQRGRLQALVNMANGIEAFVGKQGDEP